jgi:hypothetical protein
MRSLLLIVLSLTLASDTFAQTPAPTGSHVGAEARKEVRTKREFIKLTPSRQHAAKPNAAQPNAENFKLSYFNETLPTFDWVAPAFYGEYVLIDLGQRFTLPAESGFVDSVRIYFDTAWGARLAVSLYADTLFETGAGAFHLMNDFGEVEPYGSAVIEAEGITPKSWVTIDMGRAAVPKEFFVRITPEDDGIDYISWYTLRTEQEPLRARTTENSRSAFYGIAGQNYTTAILDSTFFSIETDEVLIGDFWIEVFVSVGDDPVPSSRDTLRNYDITKPSTYVEAPGVQGNVAYTGFGERFTLSGESGYLDSIRIHFGAVSGDVLQIGIFRDELRTNTRGTFHLADYSFDGLIAVFELDISGMQDATDFWVTFPTDHLPIPKEFHVGIGANPLTQGSDEYTSSFRLIGEAHYGQEPSIDSRSDILLTEDFFTFTTDIFDGFFTLGGRSLGINFHIDAVVDQTPSSVKTAVSRSMEVYPNPVSSAGVLHIPAADPGSTITLYDMLGSQVFRAEHTTTNVTLPAISAGVYSLVLTNKKGTQTQKIIVR